MWARQRKTAHAPSPHAHRLHMHVHCYPWHPVTLCPSVLLRCLGRGHGLALTRFHSPPSSHHIGPLSIPQPIHAPPFCSQDQRVEWQDSPFLPPTLMVDAPPASTLGQVFARPVPLI